MSSHRRYYCKNRAANDEEVNVEDSDELARPARSPKIAKVAQPSVSTHALPCLLCGYKGYSQRGMRRHLRMAHTLAMFAAGAARSNNNDAELFIPSAM